MLKIKIKIKHLGKRSYGPLLYAVVYGRIGLFISNVLWAGHETKIKGPDRMNNEPILRLWLYWAVMLVCLFIQPLLLTVKVNLSWIKWDFQICWIPLCFFFFFFFLFNIVDILLYTIYVWVVISNIQTAMNNLLI